MRLFLLLYVSGLRCEKRCRFLGGVQLSCVGTALSVLVVLVSVYLVTGLDIVSASQESIRLALQQDPEYSKQLYLAVQNILGSPADSQIAPGAAIDALYTYLEQGVSYSVITALAAYIPLGGLIFYLIPRAIAKKTGAEVTYVPPFSKFQAAAEIR